MPNMPVQPPRSARFDRLRRLRSAFGRMLTAVLPLTKGRRQGPSFAGDSPGLLTDGSTIPEGSLIGQDGGEHVIAFAPVRSGMGVGVVAPIPRDERRGADEGWRSTFCPRSPFRPGAGPSMRFNPLTEIRRGCPHDERDARKLAGLVVSPDDGEEALESLMVALILHFFYAEADKSFAGIARFLTDPTRPVRRQFYRMLNTRHLSNGVHPVVASGARRALGLSPSERVRVLARAVSSLSLCLEARCP